jgi:hypothetical protein
VTLRFRISGRASSQSYTVNNVVLSGTAGKPPVGPFATFESGPVRPLVVSCWKIGEAWAPATLAQAPIQRPATNGPQTHDGRPDINGRIMVSPRS